MAKKLGSGWIPAGSFGVAVLLSMLCGPLPRAISRQAGEGTSICHIGSFSPGKTQIQCDVDGVLEPARQTVLKDLDPFDYPELKRIPQPRVVKCTGSRILGDLVVKVTAIQTLGAGAIVPVALDTNDAKKNLDLVGPPEDCCHTTSERSKARLSGGIEIGGIQHFGHTSVSGQVVASHLVEVLRNDCEGHKLAKRDRAAVKLNSQCDGDGVAATTCQSTGQVTLQEEIEIDGAVFKGPPRVTKLDNAKAAVDNHQFNVRYNEFIEAKENEKDFRLHAHAYTLGAASAAAGLIGASSARVNAGANHHVQALELKDKQDKIVVPP
jgi:hypothetical protein